jgi:hypothetical protein
MKPKRIRPTFSIALVPDPDRAMEEFRSRLADTPHVECTRSKGRCAEFFVEEDQRTIWSPHLSIQLESMGEGALLRGRYGPHPELWTLYMFLYFLMGLLATLGLILAFVQWQSGMDAWGLWIGGIGLAGGGGLYLISAMGQKLSAHQMEDLKGRVNRLVEGLEAPDQSPSR